MKNNILKLCVALLAVTLASCLDDDKYALDPEGTQNVIEFYDASVPTSPAGAIYPAWTTSFSVSPEATLVQRISYSGPQDNDKDIVLTLAVDPVALQEFNFQMDTLGQGTYELLPASNYSIPSMTVTIPRGQDGVDVSITLFPDQFDLSRNFAIPLRIVSASSGALSRHWSVAILATVVKNKYDGVFTVTPYGNLSAADGMDDVTTAAFYGIYPKTIELRTVNGNTVNYFDQEYNLQGHIFSNAGAATYFGGFAAQFAFDVTTNQVTSVVNAFGQTNNNRSGKLNLDPAAPAPVMTFEADGVTPKTLDIWYIMRQNNTSTDRAFFKERYTYEGPRD
jgi:hypothetical protein